MKRGEAPYCAERRCANPGASWTSSRKTTMYCPGMGSDSLDPATSNAGDVGGTGVAWGEFGFSQATSTVTAVTTGKRDHLGYVMGRLRGNRREVTSRGTREIASHGRW